MRASSCSSRRRRRSACVGAYAFDHTRLEARARLRLRPGRADRRDHPRRTDAEGDRGAVPRTRGPRGDVPGGRPLGDLRRSPRDRRHAARADRRSVERQRRRDHGRHRPQHRARVVLLRCRGALPRPEDGRRSSCRRCSTRSASPPARRTARPRPRSRTPTAATRSRPTSRPSPCRRGASPGRLRADDGVLGRRRRRERLQRARPSVRQPRERDDRHPHGGRADRGRRSRGAWSR